MPWRQKLTPRYRQGKREASFPDFLPHILSNPAMPRCTATITPAPTSAVLQRNFLSLSAKVQIVRMAAAHPELGPTRLAALATDAIAPRFDIDHRAVAKALKAKDQLLKVPTNYLTKKKHPSSTACPSRCCNESFCRPSLRNQQHRIGESTVHEGPQCVQ